MGKEQGKIHFQYAKAPDYKIVYANGAIGGLTPQSEVKFDLYFEYLPSPTLTTHSRIHGDLGPEIERQPVEMPFLRESRVGVVMSPEKARALGEWLLQRYTEYQKRKEKKDVE